MPLRIEQQFAQIGLQTRLPFLQLKTTRPQLEMEVQRPVLDMQSPRPVLHIDQSQCFADAGRKTMSILSDHISSQSQQDVTAGIQRRAQAGDMMARIHEGMTIPELIASQAIPQESFNVTAVPKQPPRIWFDTSPVQIEYRPGKVYYNLRRGDIQGDLQRGDVDIYLRQQNNIKIEWVGASGSQFDAIA